MINLGFIFSTAAFIVILNFELCFSACAHAEYEINEECCPMCSPGNHVYWHCTVDTSTTCVPCSGSTYMDEPNGLNKCFPCSVCDGGLGLKVKRHCTRTADTLCEPLEGFYCTQQNKDSCIFAMKHSVCMPGQYVKQAGSFSADTECDNCTEGTFSNGSFAVCQAHSKCDSKGLRETKPGTMSSDAECGNPSSVGVIVGAIVGCVLVATAVGISIFYFGFKIKRQPSNSDLDYNYHVPVQECDAELAPDSVKPCILINNGTMMDLSSAQNHHDPSQDKQFGKEEDHPRTPRPYHKEQQCGPSEVVYGLGLTT